MEDSFCDIIRDSASNQVHKSFMEDTFDESVSVDVVLSVVPNTVLSGGARTVGVQELGGALSNSNYVCCVNRGVGLVDNVVVQGSKQDFSVCRKETLHKGDESIM